LLPLNGFTMSLGERQQLTLSRFPYAARDTALLSDGREAGFPR
jgi:hypothetical protein